jgi:hypothetical protein
MPIGYIFWGLMIIWLVFGAISWQAPDRLGGFNLLGTSLLLFLLIGLLGWQVFGAAIK